MTSLDPARLRRALADHLEKGGVLETSAWRKAVEDVPRELFLPSFFKDGPGPDGITRYTPVSRDADEDEWLSLVYRNETWVTQIDGRITANTADGPVTGFPTSSSTMPSTVVGMLESLDVDEGMNVLEVGTGTGYSTGLLCHRLGEDNVTSVEVDPAVSERADQSLEAAGYSTWTVTGDGLLGHPRLAPYDRTIATCAVRRIPYAWVRQTKPGGIILATVGPSAWSYGTGLAKLTVKDDGTAEGRIIGRTSFMPARAEAAVPLSGDLSARAAYADIERKTSLSPEVLNDWMPAFLAQLAAPGAQLVRVISDGRETVYLFDTGREAFAALTANGDEWTVRQGGPVAIWDAIERAHTAWQDAGEPDISAVRLKVSPEAHAYWIGGQQITTDDRSCWIGEKPSLRWKHQHQPLSG
ncbi:ATP-grasp peptide maturase system methyltransferase [Streptomyces sp. NBC_01754]|uniref:ATP-grasp peptide maturase system methyltransferase n=1 Tax=Streptomyces sp. NBC_01754 TaxID=2975930 RepID=UPI002DD9D843|nr:ATP-grasp peptide maturase system methyltransferase [Streptomyces sp. NBC_01754]WSC94059.1 ATP-grasp peptide maturase system methyltransferase [Streptomyces sp. NBC_01754]